MTIITETLMPRNSAFYTVIIFQTITQMNWFQHYPWLFHQGPWNTMLKVSKDALWNALGNKRCLLWDYFIGKFSYYLGMDQLLKS